MDSINRAVFANYPVNHYGEIWEKLVPLSFTRKTVLPRDILCFLEQGTVRKLFVDTEKELPVDISVDFFFEGDIFTAKADNEIERQFTYQPISKGILWYVDMREVRRLFLEFQISWIVER